MKMSLRKMLAKILESLTLKQVTLTRTNNSYVSATEFARVVMYRIGPIGIVRFNLALSANLPNNTEFELLTMGATCYTYCDFTIAGQTASAGHLLVTADSNYIRVGNYSGVTASGWYRGCLPLLLK